jgi:tetratricopeptide (TPR) repeat protein
MYKNDQAERALHLFKRIIRDFGDKSPEVCVRIHLSFFLNLNTCMLMAHGCRYNYYGEILLDRAEFTAALENLDKAIALEKERSKKEWVSCSLCDLALFIPLTV